jgi:GAF domain-containing protein
VGAVKEALDSDGPVFVSNAIADPRPGQQPSLVTEGIASLVCLPLRYEERSLGVLYVDSLTPTPRFCTLEVLVLESLADHAAAILCKLLRRQRRRREVASPNAGVVAQLRQRFAELLPTA